MMGTWLPETCWATTRREIKNKKVTSSWFFLSTLNYDARSTTHQIYTLRCYTLFLWHDFVSSATHATSQHMSRQGNNSNTDVRGAACIKNKNRFAVGCLRKGVDNFWVWCAGRAWGGRKWANNNLSVHQEYFDDKYNEDNVARACGTVWSSKIRINTRSKGIKTSLGTKSDTKVEDKSLLGLVGRFDWSLVINRHDVAFTSRNAFVHKKTYVLNSSAVGTYISRY